MNTPSRPVYSCQFNAGPARGASLILTHGYLEYLQQSTGSPHKQLTIAPLLISYPRYNHIGRYGRRWLLF